MSDRAVAARPVLLVTGGSRGIGRAICEGAAQRGWDVGINYASDRDAALEVADAVDEHGGNAVLLPGDVSVEADVQSMFEDCEKALGPVSGVVSNAGIVAQAMRLIEMDVDRLQRMLAVNTLGTLLVAKQAVRAMSRSAGGSGGAIVLMSSMAAKLGSANEFVDYAASKGAIDSFCVGLAREVASEGIRVNAIRPGLIETDMHASGGQPDRAERLGKNTPLGRAGSAAEVANAALWLLSEQASYTTGTIIDVAGGR